MALLIIRFTIIKEQRALAGCFFDSNSNYRASAVYQTLFPILLYLVHMADFKVEPFWWGFEITLSKAAVDNLNNLTATLGTAVGAVCLKNPVVGAAVAAVVVSRQTLYQIIGGDDGIVLASPWPIPLMLAPIRSANPSKDEMAWTSFSEGTWSPKWIFGGSNFTKARPVLAPFKEDLYLLHRGAGDENIWSIKYDPDLGWGESKKVSDNLSKSDVGACEYKERLCVVFRGEGNQLWQVKFDGKSWKEKSQLVGMYAASGPALAVFQDKLYCVAQGTDSQLWYTSRDGYTDWDSYVKLHGGGAYTSSGPALAVYQDTLYCVARGTDDCLWWTSFDGTKWETYKQLSGMYTSASPSLCVFKRRLFCVA